MTRRPATTMNLAPLVWMYTPLGAVLLWATSPTSPSTANPTCDGKVMRPGSTCEYWHEPGHTYAHSIGYDEAKQEMLTGHSWLMPWAVVGIACIALAALLVAAMVSLRTGRGIPHRACAWIGVLGFALLLLGMLGGLIAAAVTGFS